MGSGECPFRGLWPEDGAARTLARAATCEMHSGFQALRRALPCNIRRRAGPRAPSRIDAEDVRRDIERIDGLWNDLRSRFGRGGPYLFGSRPTIVDAFYAPVATRPRTYGVTLSGHAQRYAEAILAEPAFLEWEKEALAEAWTIPQWDAV